MDSKFDPQQIFNKGIELHHYANTAYPLDGHRVWREYRVKEEIDRVVRDQWRDVEELGVYVHIPFCASRCLYCEYTVLSGEESDNKEEYVSSLLEEIALYKNIFAEKQRTAVGFDIGGGTPTSISVRDIGRIVDSVLGGFEPANGFEMSIETTPIIAARDYDKIKGIREMGIERISMGIQTINKKILKDVGRNDNTINVLNTAVSNIRRAGFERFNLDLMYGFANQSVEEFLETIEFAIKMDPEFITLYRNRYKGTRLVAHAKDINLKRVNELYSAGFKLLTSNGFDANIGKNTFSRIEGNQGTSAYLTKRVIEGTPYLGVGLGAQNLASSALYYNNGAASKPLDVRSLNPAL